MICSLEKSREIQDQTSAGAGRFGLRKTMTSPIAGINWFDSASNTAASER